ncbi:MAG: hypothetical protein IID33_13560, partial [Planctomycetes bacterium]|nr:hypothetical protein [Planctomycetota bacterium]
EKEIILVGTVGGPNRVFLSAKLDDAGNVRLLIGGTKIGGPGFGYVMAKIPRAGIKTVMLPSRNQRDLVDVPDQVRDELDFVFAKTIDDVLAAAIPGLRVTVRRRKSRALASGKKRPKKPTTATSKRKRPKSAAKSTARPVKRAARKARK